MKSKRQEKILQLILDHDIETQEQLLRELREAGFQTTQATISRDIPLQRFLQAGRAYILSQAEHHF